MCNCNNFNKIVSVKLMLLFCFRLSGMQLFLIAVSLLTMVDVLGACTFPAALYTDIGHFEIMSKDLDVFQEHNYRQLEVSDNMITIKAMKYKYSAIVTDIVSFECVKKEGKSFIVKILKHGENDMYRCMTFIERTSYVFQWKLGKLAKSHGSVSCQDEQMILQDAPLVNKKLAENIDTYYDRKTLKIKRAVCPLIGGFILEWYNVAKQDFECQNQLPPFKYENECITGDGILFHPSEVSINECPRPVSPNGYEVKEKYLCFAHWEDSAYYYMLLKSTYEMEHLYQTKLVPCLRVPKIKMDIFEGYFFVDGVCDSTSTLSNSHDHIQMRFSKHNMEDECSDGSPVCPHLIHSEKCHVHAHRFTCRQTCGWCKQGKGYPGETFREEFQGKWLRQVQLVDDDVITIFDKHLHFPAMGDFINIGNTSTTCMKMLFSMHAPREIEYMLMLNPSKSDGCSLQTVRMSFRSRSESVLTYKISQTLRQESSSLFEGQKTFLNPNAATKCYGANFAADNVPLYNSYHKDALGWYTLVRVDPPPTTVPCGWPIHNANIQFSLLSGLVCSGTLAKTSVDSYEIYFVNCKHSVQNQHSKGTSFKYNTRKSYRLQCLANYHVMMTENVRLNFTIIQSNDLEPGLQRKYACLVYGDDTDGTIYWYPVSLCDHESWTPSRYMVSVANMTLSPTVAIVAAAVNHAAALPVLVNMLTVVVQVYSIQHVL